MISLTAALELHSDGKKPPWGQHNYAAIMIISTFFHCCLPAAGKEWWLQLHYLE